MSRSAGSFIPAGLARGPSGTGPPAGGPPPPCSMYQPSTPTNATPTPAAIHVPVRWTSRCPRGLPPPATPPVPGFSRSVMAVIVHPRGLVHPALGLDESLDRLPHRPSTARRLRRPRRGRPDPLVRIRHRDRQPHLPHQPDR